MWKKSNNSPGTLTYHFCKLRCPHQSEEELSTVHRHLYGFLLGQKTDHTNGGDHTNDGGGHTNDGSLEFWILTYFSRQIFLNTRMKKLITKSDVFPD